MSEAVIDYKVKVQNNKSCEKVLTIEIPEDRINQEYEAFYKAVAPKAKIKGFRPGKVPMEVLKTHYEKEASQNVLERLVSESLHSVLAKNSLQPLLSPVVENIDFQKDKLTYKAKIETRPEIKLSKVEGLSVKKKKVEVKKEELDKAIGEIQQRFGKYKAVEGRAVKEGDFVVVDYVCLVDGKETEDRKDDWIEVKKDEYLKGFSTQLIGLKAGDSKDVEIEFPKNMPREDMAGKKAVFKMSLKDIKELELPALDDELAKQAGDYDSFADLKEKTEKGLIENKEKEGEQELEKDILEQLAKHNKLDVPKGLVAKRVEYLIEQEKQRFKMQGMDEKLFDAEKEKLTKALEPEAKKQVQLGFLLDEIANVHKFTVTAEDVKKRFESMAAQYGQPAETIEKYYSEKREALEALKDQLRSEKSIDYIKQNAKIK